MTFLGWIPTTSDGDLEKIADGRTPNLIFAGYFNILIYVLLADQIKPNEADGAQARCSVGGPMDNDRAYLERRASEELVAATAATCDQAKAAHAELALRYMDLAKSPSNVVLLRQKLTPEGAPTAEAQSRSSA